MPHLLSWLREATPDIVLLQETKTIDEQFPALELEDMGYNVATRGQRTYNGVAVLSKRPIDVLTDVLPGDDSDTQARYLEVVTAGVRTATLYAPNGNPLSSDKFAYKLHWHARLQRHARDLLDSEDAAVLGGDYNITRDDADVYDPNSWRDDALCRPESRDAFRRLLNLGLTDALRDLDPERRHRYSWWDYRAGAWQADNGLRIDHLLLSPQAADRLVEADVDRSPRGWEKASDHTPVWCTLAEE